MSTDRASSNMESLQEAYGDPDDLDTYGDTTFYVYGKLDAWLSFDHNDSEGKIIGVDITHRPDKLPA